MNENDQAMNEQGAAETAAPVENEAQAPEIEKRLRALEEREAALDLRERPARCRAALIGRELPEGLVNCLDLSSDERADASLEALAAAFNDALNERVRARLGAEPPRAASAPQDGMAAVRKAMGLE